MMRVKTPHFLRTSLETFPIQCYGDLQRGCSAREWFPGFDCLLAGFHACGRDQRTEPVWRLSNHPLETFGPRPLISLYDPQRRQGAAALSAAVTTTKPQGIALPGARRGTEPVWRLSGRPRHPFGSPLISLYDPQRRQVAAALSAAVTTTKPQGIAPTSHGRTSREEKSSLFPATLRERGPGGEVLLLEKRPLPRSLPTYPPATLRERGREGEALLLEKRPLPQKPPPRLIERLFLCVEAGY